MKKRKLIWQLYPSYLIIILLSLLGVSWYTSGSVQRFFLDRTRADLEVQARLIEKTVQPFISPLAAERIDRICKEAAGMSVTRLTVVLPNGKVVGDSEKKPAAMENHRDRPEIMQAFSGTVGYAIRYSDTLKQNMMYAAIPLLHEGRVIAVLRTSLPITAIDRELQTIRMKIVAGGVIIALLASIVSLLVSRRVTRPIEEMKSGVEQFAKGDLRHRLRSPDTLELATLAESMNEVAIQLENRIATVITQRNEYQSVLSSMVEGVIAVDMAEYILSMNQSAANILGITRDLEELKGCSIQELTRSRDLHQFVSDTIGDGKMVEGDIRLYDETERIVNTQSVPLRDSEDARIGTLLVLNDVTQLRQLENIRRDFVANVSHEIKTPLTAIKGFVETLQHGGVEDAKEAGRFLEIINKHVDRLNAIVEDLLSLARIEQKGETEEINRERKPLIDIIKTAVQVIQPKADEKHIDIEIFCDASLSVELDVTLFDQALVNLVDNAVKYSPEHALVRLDAETSGPNLVISVLDEGPGIPKKHLPRLFERFYRVDKARSRKMGGTGLGLAIVKHAIQAHGGQVSVDSAPGKGTRFEIRIPGARVG